MPSLAGSKTEQNLKDAFAGESQANRRYLYFAQRADVEGYNDVSAVFRSTAEGETGHAHGHLEFLAETGDPATGKLVSRPSCSPENSFEYLDAAGEKKTAALSSGNSFDQYLVGQIFSDYLEAAEALGKSDEPLVEQVQAALADLYQPKIADDGRLMEWRLPLGEAEPGHRHISHVLGAYPGNRIDLALDEPMRGAIQKSLAYRLEHGGRRPVGVRR